MVRGGGAPPRPNNRRSVFAITWSHKSVSFRLLFDWNADHNCSHDIINFEILFRAVLMGIVAADARLGYSQIRIDGLEVSLPSLLHITGVRFGRMSEDGAESYFFKFAGGDVPLVNRPEADQPILYADAFFCRGTKTIRYCAGNREGCGQLWTVGQLRKF